MPVSQFPNVDLCVLRVVVIDVGELEDSAAKHSVQRIGPRSTWALTTGLMGECQSPNASEYMRCDEAMSIAIPAAILYAKGMLPGPRLSRICRDGRLQMSREDLLKL